MGVSADSRRVRCLLAVVCCVAVAIPFLSVTIPPITDLPQQLAQIRLFLDALHNPQSPYRIQWFTPYSLSYGLLGAAWALCPAVSAGRSAMLALGVLWTGAAHVLAAKRQRSAAAATLASVLFFNHIVYWGFLSFAIGWPSFVLWFLLTTRPPATPARWTDAVLFFAAAALLFISHALWFAMGMAWFLIVSVTQRMPVRTTALRAAGATPVVVAAALWFPTLSAAGFVSPTIWISTPISRLSPSWLVDAVMGGLRGATEYVLCATLLAWIGFGLWQHRGQLARVVDRQLCLAAALFFALALVLPDLHMNTIEFGSRWVPAALLLLLLGIPAPAFDLTLQRGATLALVAVFCLATTLAWRRFERVELSGLQEALSALPAEPRVLGLDFVQDSVMIKGRPFLQTFAYGQVLRGGQLNFSFAQFASSLVVYKTRRQAPWTNTLEWFAERVQPSDFAYFDHAVVNGDDALHALFAGKPELTPVTLSGRWRLYRVNQPAP